MGMAAILSCDLDNLCKLSFPLPKEALIGLAVSEEKIFENGGRTTDVRRTDGRRLDGYTISSPCEPNGSGELKMRTEIPAYPCLMPFQSAFE